MHRLLIITDDDELVDQIASALSLTDEGTLVGVDSWQHACLNLSTEAWDGALVGKGHDPALVASRLRYVQPDLPVFKLTSEPDVDSGAVKEYGIISLQHLQSAGPGALDEERLRLNGNIDQVKRELSLASREEVMEVLAQSTEGENVQTVSFGHCLQFLGYRGGLTERQARALLAICFEEKEEESGAASVRFQHLPEVAGDRLLYTRAIGMGFNLQLVAWPHTALRMLRVEAEALAAPLAMLVGAPLSPASQPLKLADEQRANEASQTFVLVWRPIERLPEVLHIPLRRTLVRIAQDSSCVIQFLDVRPDLIHMVVACPPGRKMVWAAHQFKSGSETAIREQFGVEALLWAKGYYAAESVEPLSDIELSLFLSRSAQSETV